MILIDTSAWVEFLRDTGSPVCREVDRLLAADIGTTDPVVMEILSGARDDRHLHSLRGLLGRANRFRSEAGDFDTAALFYRTCRQRGETVRKLIDCLIAAVAVRHAVPILHADSDFAALARHTPLAIHAPRRR